VAQSNMTNPRKDIFDTFKLRERELDELPPPAAWNKLEKRLDKHNRRMGMRVVRIWLVAVFSLLVLSVITLYVILWTAHQRPSSNHNIEKNIVPADIHLQGSMSTTFDWLLGVWYMNTASEKAMERWEKKDEQTLIGSYYWITSKDTLLISTMKLINQGGHWCYELKKNDALLTAQYCLVKTENEAFVFETKTASMPQKMVLQSQQKAGFSMLFASHLETTDAISISRMIGENNTIRQFSK